jgi:endonuclease G
MKRIILTILFLFSIQMFSEAQQEATTSNGRKVILKEDGSWVYADSPTSPNFQITRIPGLEIPAVSPGSEVITHTGYSLSYNEKHEQANWVAYELTAAETEKKFARTDKFKPDPLVKTGSATDADYTGQGYDRGHLAPAADMGWSEATVAESFYYSNMSPQLAAFNRGVWKRLEELMRNWALENQSVYIVTGPILKAGLKTIGPNKVSVPDYYYKVVLDYTDPTIKGIGFILRNAASSEPLQQFAVTIDSVEKVTGFDFFPLLPDDQESRIEKNLCIPCWNWSNDKAASQKADSRSSNSVQCQGQTKTGSRCKNNTLNASGYCYLHEGQAITNLTQNNQKKSLKRTTSVQCTGTTKAGNRCKHMTYSQNGRCYQHGGN